MPEGLSQQQVGWAGKAQVRWTSGKTLGRSRAVLVPRPLSTQSPPPALGPPAASSVLPTGGPGQDPGLSHSCLQTSWSWSVLDASPVCDLRGVE